VLYCCIVAVIWRKSKKMNGVDSDSEIDEAMTDRPPDIADEASTSAPPINGKKESCHSCPFNYRTCINEVFSDSVS
jgi:hypothetical protein